MFFYFSPINVIDTIENAYTAINCPSLTLPKFSPPAINNIQTTESAAAADDDVKDDDDNDDDYDDGLEKKVKSGSCNAMFLCTFDAET